MDHVLWSMVVNIELVVEKFIGMDRKFWSIVLDLMTLIWHHIGPIFSVKILILNNRTVPWSIKMDLNLITLLQSVKDKTCFCKQVMQRITKSQEYIVYYATFVLL